MNNVVVPDVPPGTPFRRYKMKVAELNFIRAQPEPLRTALRARVLPYKGRGKNHNYPFIKKAESGGALMYGRLWHDSRSKYSPRQGEREIARRLKRMA